MLVRSFGEIGLWFLWLVVLVFGGKKGRVVVALQGLRIRVVGIAVGVAEGFGFG